MLTLFLWYATFLADPVTIVQLRYPVVRTTITTASGYNVFYSLPSDAPLELRRAYKALEIAERDVIVIEALQRLRIEIINNERRLEALRAARLAVYLSNHIRGPQLRYFGPLMQAPSPSLLRAGVSYGLASEPTVERVTLAQERLVAARQQLHQALYAIAYPERAKLAPQPDPVPIPLPMPMPAPVPPPLPAAQRRDRGYQTPVVRVPAASTSGPGVWKAHGTAGSPCGPPHAEPRSVRLFPNACGGPQGLPKAVLEQPSSRRVQW